jgi:hypothetical protein
LHRGMFPALFPAYVSSQRPVCSLCATF